MTDIIDTYSDDNNAICPYCGEESEYEAEDLTYEENESSEVNCHSCQKDFVVWCTGITFSRESSTLEEDLQNQIEMLDSRIKRFDDEKSKLFVAQWKAEQGRLKKRLLEMEREDGSK